MKNRILLSFACIVAILAACTKTGDTPADKAVTPEVASSTVADGATGIGLDLGVIDLVFNTSITLKDASKISMGGVSLETAVSNKRLRISFGALEYGKQYNLSLAAGAVASADGSLNKAYSLNFTTEEKYIDPDEPIVDPDATIPSVPVTKDAIANSQKLYTYLKDDVWGKKTLSAAMAKVNWNIEEAEWINTHTGKYPAVATFDYIHLKDSGTGAWINYGDISVAKDWFDNGGIVSIGWHWSVPKKQGSSDYAFYSEGNTFQAKNVPVSGTWENSVATADLDKVAAYLLQLQAEGIPVIWRPLHEAAGKWFWWGAQGGDAYRALWIFVFDYLKKKGVRNLIWVWTTETSSSTSKDWSYYPGDEYVDIVGRDIYNVNSANSVAGQFSTISGYWPQKMVALSECGNVADMSAQWNAGAKWLFFMPWYDYDLDGSRNFAHEHANINWWVSSFANDAVITRDELPSDLYE